MQLGQSRFIQTSLRLGAVALAAVVLVWLVDVRALAGTWMQADAVWLIVGLACLVLATLVLGIRLTVVVNAFGGSASVLDGLRAVVLGNVISVLAPFGAAAGDCCRIYCLTERRRSVARSTSGVLVDRVVGVVTLAAITALLAGRYLLTALDVRAAAMVCGGALLVAAMWGARNSRAVAWLATRLARRLPGDFAACWREARDCWRAQPRKLVRLFGLALLGHALAIASLAMASQSFGSPVLRSPDAFFGFAAATAVALFASVLPFGLMELAFAGLLTGAGVVSPEVAVSVALVNRCATFAWAVPILVVNAIAKARSDDAKLLVPAG